jgi:hypothetical protein
VQHAQEVIGVRALTPRRRHHDLQPLAVQPAGQLRVVARHPRCLRQLRVRDQAAPLDRLAQANLAPRLVQRVYEPAGTSLCRQQPNGVRAHVDDADLHLSALSQPPRTLGSAHGDASVKMW